VGDTLVRSKKRIVALFPMTVLAVALGLFFTLVSCDSLSQVGLVGIAPPGVGTEFHVAIDELADVED
jgi:hypothetical protein